nr:hypothetical protein [uncultured Pseudomonas sp.]
MSTPNDLHASVVAGSLAVFMPGVSTADREDILLGNLFAQLTTRDEYAEGLVTDWFGEYRRKLKFLGWDATPPPDVALPGPDRTSLKQDALALIKHYGSPDQADAMGQAMDALAADSSALNVFDVSIRRGENVHFQLLPCIRQSGDHFDMVIYHAESVVNANWKARTVLTNWDSGFDFTRSRIELVRFNLRLFRDQHKQRVLERVQKKSRDFLRSLNLKAPGSP